MILALLLEYGLEKEKLAAVGVSSGGPLNTHSGVIQSPPNLPGWSNINLREFFSSLLPGIPVYLENDANATAVAEHRWGAGKGVDNLAYLTCGTGIGAGIILDGKLYRGKYDLAGELGHAVIVPGGPLCLCGKRGCLEAVASGGAIGRIGSEFFSKPRMTGRDVIELAQSGDFGAKKIVQDAAYFLGIGIANLLQTLNLERVIIGSLALYAGQSFLDTVRATVKDNTWPSIYEKSSIVCSGLGERTQDLAALAIAVPMEHSGHNREE